MGYQGSGETRPTLIPKIATRSTMKKRLSTLIVFTASLAVASVNNVTVRGTTPTQAILTYTLSAPTGSACMVEVSQSPNFTPLAHDVDPALFSGAQYDSRVGTIGSGIVSRVFVAGTRGAAQQGSDGKWYSRALAANTLHYFRINNDGNCDGGGAVTGTFTTRPIPSGRLYNDPIPADGAGGVGWCRFYGNSRAPCVDPQTGAVTIPLNVPGENISTTNSAAAFGSSYDPTGNWGNSGDAATGAGPAATFSGSGETPLFFAVNLADITNSWGASYEAINGNSIDYLQVNVTGFGAGSTAGSRNVTGCWSLAGGGNRCDSPVLTQTLPTSSGTITFGGHTAGMTDWGAAYSGLDPVLAGQHSGTVTNAGNGVFNWAGGNYFRPQANGWMAGTRITFTGGCTGTYSLASIQGETQLTLTNTSPTCSSGAIHYTVTPLTFILAKATASTDQITVSLATFDYQTSSGQGLGSSAMQDGNMGCGPTAVPGVNPPGYICGSTVGYYLVQPSTPAATFLGRWVVPYNTPGGTSHPAIECPPMGFSLSSPNTIWCFGPAFGGETYLLSVTYTAANYNAVPPGTVLPVCTGSNQPCLTVTGPVGGGTLEAQFAASGFAAAKACCLVNFTNVPPLLGGQLGDGNIQLQAWLGGTQGLMSIFAVYNPVTASYIAARDSWSYYPVTFSGVHSVQLRRGAHFGLPLGWIGHGTQGGAIGPLSGTDTFAGFGPYRMKTTSTMTSVSCPVQPSGSPIPASLWPGGSGNQPGTAACYQFTVDGGMCDPSPYAATIIVNGTTGTNAISLASGSASRSWIGKPIIISGNTYTIASFVDNSDLTVTPNLLTSPSGVSATFEGEPPDSGAGGSGHCGHAGDFYLRDPKPGDILFVGQPTPGVTGYADDFSTTGPINGSSEAFMVTTVTGTSVLTVTAQGNYSGAGHAAWASGSYLYGDSGAVIGENGSSWDFPWDYVNDPTGSLGKVGFDSNPPQGHGFLADAASFGYLDGTPPCPVTTQWDGVSDHQCLIGRFGANLGYITAPAQQIAYAPAFSGQTGSGLANPQDLHPNYPYFTSPQFAVDGRVWNGDTNRPAAGTPVAGQPGVIDFSYSQRGCSSAAQCIALEKVLPLQVNVGQVPGLNLSGPSSSITTSSPIGAFATVVKAGEGTPGSSPGDLVIYAPRSEGTSYGAYIANGGDHVDVGAYFTGPWMQGIVREGFTGPSLAGDHIQWIGHNQMRPRMYSPFFNVRGTPDNLAIISQVPLLDGVRTMDVVTRAATVPTGEADSINGADFVPIALTLNAPAGMGIDNAMVEFGYAENGNPASGPFCTPRAEICVKGNQAENLFNYETSEAGAYSGQPCAISCTITAPGISGRVLYYRIKYRAGSTVRFTTPLDVVAVP